jgi:hypothetical protein
MGINHKRLTVRSMYSRFLKKGRGEFPGYFTGERKTKVMY